jgi:uncharacterized DUF497 family protein
LWRGQYTGNRLFKETESVSATMNASLIGNRVKDNAIREHNGKSACASHQNGCHCRGGAMAVHRRADGRSCLGLDVVTYCSYNWVMRFEWDQRKRRANLAAHGIDFADLESLFKGATITVLDDRYDYGEFRFITLGLLNGIVITVAHTETDEILRIISARKATRYEEKNYFKKIGK